MVGEPGNPKIDIITVGEEEWNKENFIKNGNNLTFTKNNEWRSLILYTDNLLLRGDLFVSYTRNKFTIS